MTNVKSPTNLLTISPIQVIPESVHFSGNWAIVATPAGGCGIRTGRQETRESLYLPCLVSPSPCLFVDLAVKCPYVQPSRAASTASPIGGTPAMSTDVSPRPPTQIDHSGSRRPRLAGMANGWRSAGAGDRRDHQPVQPLPELLQPGRRAAGEVPFAGPLRAEEDRDHQRRRTIWDVEDGFVKKQIDRVAGDNDVVAVVLRINSPGGTITGSDLSVSPSARAW